jgi:hypothetical protein
MSKRPVVVTVIGWFFVCVGVGSLARGGWRFIGSVGHPGPPGSAAHEALDMVLVAVSALLAGAGGAFLLRGHSWARWLLLFWMGAHVAIGVLHSPWQTALHGVFFVALLFLLTRPAVSAYYRGGAGAPP